MDEQVKVVKNRAKSEQAKARRMNEKAEIVKRTKKRDCATAQLRYRTRRALRTVVLQKMMLHERGCVAPKPNIQ